MPRIAREWYVPIAFVVVLVVAAQHVLPRSISALVMLAVAVAQITTLTLRLRQRLRIGQVTYWRGVRYESPARGISMSMLRDEWVHIIIALMALLLGLAMW